MSLPPVAERLRDERGRRVWGGVLKRRMLLAFGLRDTPWYRWRAIGFRLFVWDTRRRYRRLAARVVGDVEDYRRSGIEVVAIVGVGGSPSCGTSTTLDLRRSFETIAACPLARVTRAWLNDEAITGCAIAGDGLFIRELRRRLARRGIDVPFMEYNLLAEMRGERQALGLPA